MYYCESCKKEVVVYGVSPGMDDELDKLRQEAEAEGKIVLFNPPPVGSYNCPICGTKLLEK